jgi:cytidylate kinase
VLGISQTGGVILGRGANFILRDQQQFRLRVVGSLDVCAGRVAKRKGIDLVEARRRVAEVNSQRAAFVRDFLGADTTRPEAYDLVVNTDRLSVDAIVEMVMLAMRHGAGT